MCLGRAGPTLAGCSVGSAAGKELVLHFNGSLLGSEQLLLRNVDTTMANWAWRYDSSHQRLNKTDSSVLMVCTASDDPEAVGNATTCQCSSWSVLETADKRSILYCR